MDIPQFIDLTDHSILEGDKIKLEDVLNKSIVVTGSHLTNSKFADRGSGKCVKIQFYFEDDIGKSRRIFFSGSGVLYDQIKEMQERFDKNETPMLFRTTIRKIGNYYSMT